MGINKMKLYAAIARMRATDKEKQALRAQVTKGNGNAVFSVLALEARLRITADPREQDAQERIRRGNYCRGIGR